MSADETRERARGWRRCECGHSKLDHTGRLTRGDGWTVLSETACLHGTTVARIGNWHAERVGGDLCERWRFSLRETLRGLLTPPVQAPSGDDA